MTNLSNIQRRQLLKAVGAFFVAHGAGLTPALGSEKIPANLEATLAAFVDILLPKDASSPAASTLGVHSQILGLAPPGSQFEKLLDYGCRWLNMTGGPPFAELPPIQQYQIVKFMTTAPWNEVPRRFYEIIRATSVSVYYGDPAAWNGLSLTQPPQPMGYPPPWA